MMCDELAERGITSEREQRMLQAENGCAYPYLREGVIRDRAFAAHLWSESVEQKRREGIL
jgi:hypothetical protein